MGSRAAAWAIDALAQAAILVAGFLIAQAALGDGSGFDDLGRIDVGRGMALAFYLILLFLVKWGYFALFESLMSGQSPGKRAMGVKVVTSSGEPLDFASVAVRNLVRAVDDFPGIPLLGGLVALSGPKGQRLGDMAASTIVVKARRDRLVPPSEARLSAESAGVALPELAGRRLSEAELGVLRKYLNERDMLPAALAAGIAATLASQAQARTGAPRGSLSDLAYIESIYRAHATARSGDSGRGRR